MYENNTPKAVVIKTFTFGSIELRLTEKGAVTIYRNTDRGTSFCQALKPSDVKLHAELGNPAFQGIVDSPEWAAIQESKERAKVSRYADQKLALEQQRAAKMVQAGIDRLKAMGIDPAAVLKQQA